jgi:hypothetical protein
MQRVALNGISTVQGLFEGQEREFHQSGALRNQSIREISDKAKVLASSGRSFFLPDNNDKQKAGTAATLFRKQSSSGRNTSTNIECTQQRPGDNPVLNRPV